MKSILRVRTRLYEILDVAGKGDRASRAFDLFIVLLIGLNVVALVLETVQPIAARWQAFFDVFEFISVIVFSAEYILRLWSCVTNPKYVSPVTGRVRFALTPMALIDFLAVAPFYLPFIGVDLRFVRAVRLFRLFRIAKVARYSTALRTLGRVFVAKKEELVVTLFVLFLLLLMASCTVYFAQPDAFSSIPEAMWWGVATLRTVGYGDVYPVTPLGKIIAACVAILGIGMFALPTGILGAGFVEEVQKRKKTRITCPHCGEDLPL